MGSKIPAVQLTDNIWRFSESEENPFVDAYLICGSKRALVADALTAPPDLYQAVRDITELPLDLVLTHGHHDHAGASIKGFKDAGVPIYLYMRDYSLIRDGEFGGIYTEDWFTDVKDGEKFDLGDRVLEIIAVAGHTPGSLVLYDSGNQELFTGDTIGAGVFWMQLPSSLPIDIFNNELEALYQRVKDDEKLIIYPGHSRQSPQQLTIKYLEDVRAITQGLLTGEMTGIPASMDFHGIPINYSRIEYGQVWDYCYRPERI